MNTYIVASALLVAAMAGIASANLVHKGSFHKGHSSHNDDFFEEGFGHRGPLQHYNDELLIQELRFRGIFCSFRDSFHHRPGFPLGHGPVITGRSGKGKGLIGGSPLIGLGVKKESGAGFGSFQGSSGGAIRNSDASDRNVIAANSNNLELDNSKNNHANLDITNQHQVINKDKTFLRDRTTGTNDVTNIHASKGNSENSHLGASNSNLLAENESERHNSGASFGTQGSGSFGNVHESSAAGVGVL